MRHTFVLVAIALSVSALLACGKKVDEPSPNDWKPASAAPPAPLPPPPKELQITDEVVGKGREAKVGDSIHVQYTGTLMNGKKFDSSYDHTPPAPFDVKLGSGGVIQGWEKGIPGMKVGGKRKLVIPPELGYGDRGFPPDIPPKAGLVFEIELVSID